MRNVHRNPKSKTTIRCSKVDGKRVCCTYDRILGGAPLKTKKEGKERCWVSKPRKKKQPKPIPVIIVQPS